MKSSAAARVKRSNAVSKPTHPTFYALEFDQNGSHTAAQSGFVQRLARLVSPI